MEINGLTGLAVMKLDVFDGMDTVKLAVGYKVDGKPVDLMPYGADAAARCEPVYEEFPGWKESTFGLTKWEDLPASAQAYLKRLSEVAGCRSPSCRRGLIARRRFCSTIRSHNR